MAIMKLYGDLISPFFRMCLVTAHEAGLAGKVEVSVGTSPHGQGHETTFGQIVADTLGVPFDDVQILHGDTASAPIGLDTYGSRSLAVGGIAVYRASQRVLDKARMLAAHLLEASEDDLEFADGSFRVKGAPDASKSIGELAFAAFSAHSMQGLT